MYIEILNELVSEILLTEGNKPKPIEVNLTYNIYDALQDELNRSCHFRLEIPVELSDVRVIKFNGRNVTLIRGNIISDDFEKLLIRTIKKLNTSEKDSRIDDVKKLLDL